MIILEQPYISEEMKQYLSSSNIPVLKNDTALSCASGFSFNLTEHDAFRNLLKSGSRIYTTSENALDWIYKNASDETMLRSIRIMKDKAAFRRLIHSLYPDFFFVEATVAELKALDIDTLKKPFILKPAVGFFSVGVYTIFDAADWKAALHDINTHMESWTKDYPDSVVGNGAFILEEYIQGDEYAIDAYFDENGQAVVLNILKHDFTSSADVSDRLYYTSKEIIGENLAAFTDFLNKVNTLVKARNFPAHIEVRIENDRIVPIEFNPMRFAGWCTTDLADFAFGVKTYDYFLNNKTPDWNTLLAGKEGKIYALIVLDKPKSYNPTQSFDYRALRERFSTVLCLRELDHTRLPVFGFLFTETTSENRHELDYIAKSDLTEFVS